MVKYSNYHFCFWIVVQIPLVFNITMAVWATNLP